MVEILAPDNLSPNSSRLEQPGEDDIEVARQAIKTNNALSDNAVVPRKRRHDEVAAGDGSSSVPKRNDHQADHQEVRKKRSAAVDSARSGNQQMLRELILQ